MTEHVSYHEIIDYLLEHPASTTPELMEHFDCPRKSIGLTLRYMKHDGYLIKDGEKWTCTDRRPSRCSDPRAHRFMEDAVLACIAHGEEKPRSVLLRELEGKLTDAQLYKVLHRLKDNGVVEYHPNRKTWRKVR